MGLTEEQLFGYLKKDGIEIDAQVIKDAQKGGGEALWSIGYEYDVGKQQYDKAMAWFRLSAKKNYPHAQNNIGMLYRNGQGVHADFLTALEWWLRAAKQCNVLSFINIGDLFSNGHGVPANDVKAQQWYHINEVKSDKEILLRNLINETNAILITEKRKKLLVERKEENKSPFKSKSNVSVERKGDEEEERKRAELVIASDIDNQVFQKGSQQQKEKKQKNTDSVKQVQKRTNEEIADTSDETEALEDNTTTDENTIAQLTEQINKLHKAYSRKRQEVNSLKTTKEAIECERKILELENKQLKETNQTFHEKIRDREHMIHSMKKRIHQSASEDQDNEEIKVTFKMLLKSQANEIELLKQNMKLLLEREKESRRRLKKKNQELKRKMEEDQLSLNLAINANYADKKYGDNKNKNKGIKKRKVTFADTAMN